MTTREVWAASKSMPNVSLTTDKRYLRQSNLHGRVAAKKLLLNALEIKKDFSGASHTFLSVLHSGIKQFSQLNVASKDMAVVVPL